MTRGAAAAAPIGFVLPEGLRALVLGASGFIGAEVLRCLHRLGVEVVASGRTKPRTGPASNSSVEFLRADLAEVGRGVSLVEQARPDWVLNLCGYGVDRSERDPDLARRINAELPLELAEGLARLREGVRTRLPARLLHVGSALEYGVQGGDLAEESVPRPTTLYGITKLAGTEALAERSKSDRKSVV